MNRRTFLKDILKKGAAFTGAAIASRPLGALAESLASMHDPHDKDPLLKKINRAELSDKEKKYLLEALRSAECFRHAAKKIDLPHKPKLVGLYPAAGSHLASLEMARVLLEDRPELNEVELRFTEIDGKRRELLLTNLENLGRFDKKYKLLKDEIKIEKQANGGSVTLIPVQVGEKKVTIRYLLNCTGDEFFDDQNFNESDFFINHDSSGQDSSSVIEMIMTVAQKTQATGKTMPLIVDDTRREYTGYKKTEERSFDLELFADKIVRVNGPYGHRGEIVADETDYPEVHKAETEEAAYSGAAIINLRPQINAAKPEVLKTLEATDGIAERVTGFGDKQNVPKNQTETDLFMILQNHGEAEKLVDSIDPKLATGFALRQIAAISHVLLYEGQRLMEKHSSTNPETSLAPLQELLTDLKLRLRNKPGALEAITVLQEVADAQIKGYPLYLAHNAATDEWGRYTKAKGIEFGSEYFREKNRTDEREKQLSKIAHEAENEWKKICIEPFEERLKQINKIINQEANKIFDNFDKEHN